MKRETDNGREGNFFSVRSEEDLASLEDWLQEREYNQFTQDENFKDRHGKPIIGLRFAVDTAQRQPPINRGVVWFKNPELRKQGGIIVKRLCQKIT